MSFYTFSTWHRMGHGSPAGVTMRSIPSQIRNKHGPQFPHTNTYKEGDHTDFKFSSRNLLDSHPQRRRKQPESYISLFHNNGAFLHPAFQSNRSQGKKSDEGPQGKRKPPSPQRGGWGREGAWPVSCLLKAGLVPRQNLLNHKQ